jgi:hypothetical protein
MECLVSAVAKLKSDWLRLAGLDEKRQTRKVRIITMSCPVIHFDTRRCGDSSTPVDYGELIGNRYGARRSHPQQVIANFVTFDASHV